MLKIKDEVPLEKLKEYGFTNNNEYEQYEIENWDIFVGTDENERELVLDFGFNNKNISVLYDLIQAGLVEKIEEEK